MKSKINLYNKGEISNEKFKKIVQGWSAYANWANSYNNLRKIIRQIIPAYFHPSNSD